MYYGMVDKDKMELMNLRRRVRDQREEIKRLQEENEKLRKVISDAEASTEIILGKIDKLNRTWEKIAHCESTRNG